MAAHSTLPRSLAAALTLVIVPAIFCLLAEEGAAPAAAPGKQLFADNFSSTLAQWVVEQQPGGTVTIKMGRLVIDDVSGCTIWFHPKLTVPVVITYTATVAARPRASDLNCFWMATDPARPGDLLTPGHRRDGRFACLLEKPRNHRFPDELWYYNS